VAVCRAMRPRAEGMPVSLPSRNRIKPMRKSYRMRPQIVNEIRRRNVHPCIGRYTRDTR